VSVIEPPFDYLANIGPNGPQHKRACDTLLTGTLFDLDSVPAC
jgi:hypothetical protein